MKKNERLNIYSYNINIYSTKLSIILMCVGLFLCHSNRTCLQLPLVAFIEYPMYIVIVIAQNSYSSRPSNSNSNSNSLIVGLIVSG